MEQLAVAAILFMDWLTQVAWPITVIVIALVFRSSIVEVLRGITSLSSRVTHVAGIQLRVQESETAEGESEKIEEAIAATALPDDPLLHPILKAIEDHLTAENITGPNLVPRMKRAWAQTALLRDFDRIARDIFSTQLKVLRLLATDPGTRIRLVSLYDEHSTALTTLGMTANDFDTWLRFLVNNGLVEKEKKTYHLTQRGQAFLAHFDLHFAYYKPPQL